MSKRNLTERIKLTSYEDMFGENGEEIEQTTVNSDGQIKEVPLKELHTFKGHPFRVLDDEKMDETVESVKKYGILVPGIARPLADGGYEIISGHRRHHAASLAGLETMPMIIKDCSDDEATVIMVDANIQREDILPSEKAKAYSMKYEALKHQGILGGLTLETMGETVGENAKTVQRFIWLSRLSDNLLELVDQGKLGMGQGVDFSFLSVETQSWVYGVMLEKQCGVSGAQSAMIKEKFKEGNLTATYISEVLGYEKPVKRKVTFDARKLDSYFSPNMTSKDIESLIIKLLDDWKEKGGDE